MKKQILTILLALSFSCGVNSQALTQQQMLEDYDYLVSFVEENYAPFDAIMQIMSYGSTTSSTGIYL